MEAKTRGIAFTIVVDDNIAVNADRQMLGSAVSNLLQNAFKFTRHNSLVTLTGRAAAARILIEVKDECGGLKAGIAEELFKPFEQQGDNRSGLGLGLSISRRAVEANGGELRVQNIPGTGCIFTIDLPRLTTK